MNGEGCGLWARRHRVALALAAVWVLIVIIAISASGSPGALVIVIIFAPALLGGLLRYIYVRSVKPFTQPLDVQKNRVRDNDVAWTPLREWTRREVIGTFVFVILIAMAFLSLVLSEFLVGEEPNAFIVFSRNLFGSLAILLVMLPLADAVDLAINFAKGPDEVTGERLRFVSTVRAQRVKSGLALLAYLIATTVTLALAYQEPTVERVRLELRKLPACLDGYTIALISDMHAGPLVGRTEIAKMVQQVNGLGADAIVLVGDFADGVPDDLSTAVAPLADLSAPDGVFFVTGNHEYLHGSSGSMWPDKMATLGITPLNNSRASLPLAPSPGCTDSFDLVGVNDFSLGDPDLPAAIAGRDPLRAAVLLAHQPANSIEADELGMDLQLSGHVHGGQTWPLHGLTYVDQPQFAGTEKQGDMLVYTSQGVFGWGPRTRFMSENNIDLITLAATTGEPNNDLSVSYTIVWAWLSFPFIAISVLCCIGLYAVPKVRADCSAGEQQKHGDV